MSNAQDLVKKIASDDQFRSALSSATTIAEKRALLVANGFGDVTPQDVAAQAHQAVASIELTDDQLKTVATAASSNDTITTTTTTTTVFAAAAGAVAAG
jgi:hypothetical protein